VLQQGATVDAIVHMTAITVARAIRREALERAGGDPGQSQPLSLRFPY
jgi:hypothetical protein